MTARQIEENSNHRVVQVSLPFELTIRLIQLAFEKMNAEVLEVKAKKKRGAVAAKKSNQENTFADQMLVLIEEKEDQCNLFVFSTAVKPEDQPEKKRQLNNILTFEKFMRLMVFDTVRQYRKSFLQQTIEETRKKEAHEILEISPNANREEIISAYRQKVKLYHPDQVSRMAEEFKELAENRMKTINAAFKEMMERHG